MPSRRRSSSGQRRFAVEEVSSPSLKRLLQARNEFDRLYQLSSLLKEARIDVPDFFDSSVVWSSICRETDSERLAWKLAREISRRGDGRVPACLEPFLDCPELAEEEAEADREQLRAELADWLREDSEVARIKPKRSLRVVWKVSPGVDPLESEVSIDLRANSSKLKEGSRNFFQVRGLCNELAHRPELFTAEDAVLLRWLSDYLSLLCTDKNKHGSPFLTDNRSLLIWLQRWPSGGRCTFEDGSPVGFDPLPARVVPSLTAQQPSNGHRRNAAVKMDFDVVTAGGLRAPLRECHLLTSSKSESNRLELELVAVNGCFYRLTDRPPLTVLGLALKHENSIFEGDATRQLLPPLLRRYPSLQSQVKLHLRQVPSDPVFYFMLDGEDMLHMRLLANARAGNLCWEWTHEGWRRTQRVSSGKGAEAIAALPAPEVAAEDNPELNGHATSAPGKAPAEVWDDVPAEDDVLDACEWLARWGGEPGEVCGRPEEPGWWLMVDGRRLGPLLKLWRERSARWQCYGNRRFEQLVSGRRHKFPKVRIQSSGMDWFTVKTEWEEEGEALSLTDWQKLRENDDPFVKLSNGRWIARDEAEKLQEVAGALADLGLADGAEQKVSTLELAGGQAETWAKLSELSDGELGLEVAKLREAVDRFEGVPEITQPQGLKASLRPYQRQGLDFLVYTSRLGLGAILADDMGLGKTVQALAWLEHLREEDGPSPTLVVCPASVVFNWHREAEQFTPGQRVLTLTAGEKRHGLRDAIPKHDLIITNYALLRRDLAALKKFNFRAVVLDEAQNIKNPDSMVAKAAKALNTTHRLALTGTPLENRLLDLWSIIDFVNPGYLPPRGRFVEQFDRGAPPQARSLLSARLRPLVLRRLKRQVAKDLPDRIEERIDCELTPGQRKFYLAELQRSRNALRGFDPAYGQGRMHALAALTRLRQICCHPTLAEGKGNLGSGKTTVFLDTLESLHAQGHKVLVFSQFVQMLKLLQTELDARNWPYYLLTGQTNNRGDIVEAFQQDKRPAIFLLSLKAAGTGLNLTSASYVILYDPWWNPAVEAQAIDRTHRIGQHRTVMAYRLVTRDTVEEKIWQLQQKKAQLVSDVLGEQGFNGSLTKDDLEFLLAEPEED